MAAWVLLTAFLLDLTIGDPRICWHPVRLIGNLVSRLDHVLHRPGRAGLWSGALLALVVPPAAATGYLVPRILLSRFPEGPALWIGLVFDVVILYSCVAFKDLFDHLRPIEKSLVADDLEAAQNAVQMIVGRDARLLDSAGVARAAIESVAESLSDGSVAPIFWYTMVTLAAITAGSDSTTAAVLGVASAVVFRAANTVDSMIGRKSERYLLFGRAGARLDDVLCWIPARFAVICLFLSALSLGANALEGLRIRGRDGRLHPSPNAGQGESFVAGALGLKLGGPTKYSYGESHRPWLGDGVSTVGIRQLRASSQLVLKLALRGVVGTIVLENA